MLPNFGAAGAIFEILEVFVIARIRVTHIVSNYLLSVV